MPTPTARESTKPSASAVTRIEDQAITPSTEPRLPPDDSAPARSPFGSKKRNWSARLARNRCGGGSSSGSAQPRHHANSHIPTNNPTDPQAHNAARSRTNSAEGRCRAEVAEEEATDKPGSTMAGTAAMARLRLP